MPPAKQPTADAPATGPEGGTASDPVLAEKLDGLNLDQALLDFAAANSRVLDLTRRLCGLNDEVVALRDENVRQQIELERLRRIETRADALERSAAVRLAATVRGLASRGRSATGR